jgi:predicted membrane channel-forming protein YqfA (hemolysin III family)
VREDGVPEDKASRLDRELIELLNELRVALPGVQVLFAFLLTVPFTQRFGSVTTSQRAVYFFSVLATAAATILFIAPTAYHRLRWRDRDKERMLQSANRMAIVGTVFLALSITAVVYVITSLLFGTATALGVTVAVAGLVAWLWYALPLSRRVRDR